MMKISKKSKISGARLGVLNTSHGDLKTPFFMPDATRAALKGLSQKDIEALGLEAMVVNTFHLYLQPGSKKIRQLGGVHKFMNTSIPLVSDSGGFQVFSLIHRAKGMGSIDDHGAKFKSPVDGSWHFLDPKKSIDVQLDLGTDIVICLDDCPPNEADENDIKKAIKRTITWGSACKNHFESELRKRKVKKENQPKLLAVIQGGKSSKLRKYCAAELQKIGFDGYGYGARPVDEHGNFMSEILKITADSCPEESFRFALGIGTPDDIVKCAMMGYDLFDCVIPTREGRHARLFYFSGKELLTKSRQPAKFYKTINISNSKYSSDKLPINPDSKLGELRNYSKAYLYHLFKIKDPLGPRLASLQNLEFYNNLMRKIREGIKNDKL